MAPNRGRNRAKEFEDSLEAAPTEFDPEVDNAYENDSAGDSGSDENDGEHDASREHYQAVGKSRLKQTKVAPLGPQYRGSLVDRKTLMEEELDDPFARGFAGGSSSEEEQAYGSDEDEEEHSDDEEDDALATDLTEDDEDEDTAEQDSQAQHEIRAQLLKSQAEEQKAFAAQIQKANKDDAEKGRAVKHQRQTFDSLLNTRIKLQKALVGVNSIAALTTEDINAQREQADAAVHAAEVAAFNLWSTLDAFRDSLQSARTGTKRKRSHHTTDTPSNALLERLQSQDADSETHWKAVLQKWSAKIRSTSTLPPQPRLNNTPDEPPATIIDHIQEQLSDPQRLLQRAHTPRSCAPIQLARKITTDASIYDDADFYGVLLKELLEQKSEDSVVAANIDLGFQLRRENKTKKHVDTKASKGRKLRYTVHEKLQNFMAPEDRTTWGNRQADELFGSLFGRRLALGDDVDVVDEDMGEDGVDAEEAGVFLFRS